MLIHPAFLRGFFEQYAGGDLYLWAERGTGNVACLAHEHIRVHSTMTLTIYTGM